MKRIVTALPILFGLSQVAIAQDASFLATWYASLSNGDISTLASMIDDSATLQVTGSNATQSKQEFLDYVAGLPTNTQVNFEVEGIDTGYAVAVACHDSGGSNYASLETFEIAAGQIQQYRQERFSNGC